MLLRCTFVKGEDMTTNSFISMFTIAILYLAVNMV